ncbi:MAG TPA: sulfite exporter TauE/SafE family protein [Balneolaceae bacterium]
MSDPNHKHSARSASSTEKQIGAAAQELDNQPITTRLRINQTSLKKLALIAGGYGLLILISVWLIYDLTHLSDVFNVSRWLFPVVVLLAFIFETMDSAAGMGFGTALAPLLLIMGFEPLQVVPVLLISESVTGLTSAAVHHEFKNVRFSLKNGANEATRLMLMITGFGIIAIIISVTLTYFAIELPGSAIKTYVAILVVLLGIVALARRFTKQTDTAYKPKRMIGFAFLGAFNKGIGGGGYGPVVTLGEIYSGVYEKSAPAIASLAEGLISIVGIITFFAISATGIELDFMLLPSALTGSILAAVASPYLVRVLPNRIFSYVIPAYAFIIGIILLFNLT